MEEENTNLNTDLPAQAGEKSYGGKIHFEFSHSYIIFLFAVVLGVIFDLVIPLEYFSSLIYQDIGIIMILLGSIFIFWAQSTAKIKKEKKDGTGFEINFGHGPYKYLRNPTHLGLFIMTLGLAFIITSPFSVFFTILAHIITKLVFIKRGEKLLEKKYGKEYLNYKKRTRNHL